MPGKFNQQDVDDLLAKCHRRCCICHRFCGVKIETDHMLPSAEDGPRDIANAIAVCFECHAEIHSYNDKHPRGRKFRPEELRKHKEQWLAICAERPETLLGAPRNSDVGPLQALIDELEFNTVVAGANGCPFLDNEFRRAISEGAISTVKDDLKGAILDAYAAIGNANRSLSTLSPMFNSTIHKNIDAAKPKIERARGELLQFLRSEK
jgi:hypothetical protein